MNLLIGYHDFGYVKRYKNQFIMSTFSCFIFPLKYEYSYLVDKDRNILIKRNWTSIVKTFFWLTNAIALFLLLIIIVAITEIDSISKLNFTFYYVLILFLFLVIYPNFIFGRTTKKEKIIREIFYLETGYSLMPAWISEEAAYTRRIIERAKERFVDAFNTENYTQIKIDIYNSDFNQYFVYISLKAFIYNEMKAKEIYQILTEDLNRTLLYT